VALCAGGPASAAELKLDKSQLVLREGGIDRLTITSDGGSKPSDVWSSSNPAVAEVFSNGFVIALRKGQANITVQRSGERPVECAVSVHHEQPAMLDPQKLEQYEDNRVFRVNGRKCVGSELNGQRAFEPDERSNTFSNRVINPDPLKPGAEREWEVMPGTEVFDGAGTRMGTVAPRLKLDARRVPTSKFNFGMSKVLNGRMCLYAFSISIVPDESSRKIVDPKEIEDGAVGTSAWLPLDQVVQKERLIERVGIGKPGLPALPLEDKAFRITGGNPRQYMTEFGEMSIVRDIHAGPVPSHYLKRPSGTVNVVYSVPGFGLGGQGLDSFLVSDDLTFRPATGAKVFVQPTWFPPKHPKAGEVSPMTMTFLYGAIQAKDAEPVYGWVAREAMTPIDK
jgi:hypothetical protein